MIYQYVCKFYLNASHFIYINGNKGQPHSHCFEFVLDVATKDKEAFVSFTEIEKSVEALIAPYQEQLINEIEPFDKINPTLENIASYFKDLFAKEMALKKWVLVTIELSETPTRSYLINTAEELTQNVLGKREDKIFTDLQDMTDAIHSTSDILKEKEKITEFPVKEKLNTIEPIVAIEQNKTVIKKMLSKNEDDFDYIIPENLMHFDV